MVLPLALAAAKHFIAMGELMKSAPAAAAAPLRMYLYI